MAGEPAPPPNPKLIKQETVAFSYDLSGKIRSSGDLTVNVYVSPLQPWSTEPPRARYRGQGSRLSPEEPSLWALFSGCTPGEGRNGTGHHCPQSCGQEEEGEKDPQVPGRWLLTCPCSRNAADLSASEGSTEQYSVLWCMGSGPLPRLGTQWWQRTAGL